MRKRQLWVDAGRPERRLMGTSGLSYRRIKSAVRRQTANSLKQPARRASLLTTPGRQQPLLEDQTFQGRTVILPSAVDGSHKNAL
jgi:hypothetical protein